MAYGIAAQLTLLTFTRCLVEYYPALGESTMAWAVFTIRGWHKPLLVSQADWTSYSPNTTYNRFICSLVSVLSCFFHCLI